MKNKSNSFGIIGGDKRQLFLADSLRRDGYEVIMGGFDAVSELGDLEPVDTGEAVIRSDIIILPIPSIRTDGTLNAPFNKKKIYFNDIILDIMRSKTIFASMTERLLRFYPKLEGAKIIDYSRAESFAVLNAVPTAEGALACAMEKYEGTLWNSKIMIAGFGRIGKLLARLAASAGAAVTVCARSGSDKAFARALGYEVEDIRKLSELRGFDIIFNTVPFMIFDEKLLEKTDDKTIIIDLASLPGGVDFEAARSLGIDAVRALSLPGKYAPKTAGEIIKSVILDLL